jgi:hypothetical protein
MPDAPGEPDALVPFPTNRDGRRLIDDGGDLEDWSEQFTNGSAERTEQVREHVRELESPNARKAASGMEGKGITAARKQGTMASAELRAALSREGSPPVATPVATPVTTQ